LLLSSEGHQGKGREEARQEGEAEMTPDAILGLVRTLSGALHGQYGEDVSHENLAPELAPDATGRPVTSGDGTLHLSLGFLTKRCEA
jgi:hypothetical protein